MTKQKPNRTLNMIFAMAFGCIIVSEDWVSSDYKNFFVLYTGKITIRYCMLEGIIQNLLKLALFKLLH